MLWPHYGLGMCQAAALLLVPDTPPTDKKTVKKVYNLLYTWLITLWFTISILHLYFTKNVMSGMNWAVWRLNIDICTKLSKIRLSLWDLNYYVGLNPFSSEILANFCMENSLIWPIYKQKFIKKI